MRASELAPEVPPALDAVVGRALALYPSKRFATALELARALEAAVTPADGTEVGFWVRALGATAIREQTRVRDSLERRIAPTLPDIGIPAPRREPLRRAVPLQAILQVLVLGAVCLLAAMTMVVASVPLAR